MSLTIYKSSAGSGKTYTLAKEYLGLALRSPDYYQKILAVTFTNRAAQEMKERVLDFMMAISRGDHELIAVFAKEQQKREDEIVAAAKSCLEHLLHHYGYFSITTIDTFFHRIIRAFSREIGLQGSFGIELDTEKVADLISGEVYAGSEENPELKTWLTDFSMSKLLKGDGYEAKNEIKELAKQLFTEEFKGLPSSQFKDENAKAKIRVLTAELTKQQQAFEDAMVAFVKRFDDALVSKGLSIDDLSYKKSGPAGFFEKIRNGKYNDSVGKRLAVALEEAANWSSAKSPNADLIISLAEHIFNPLVEEVLSYRDANKQQYFTAKATQQHLFTLGLITDLSQRLQDYKKEEEVILISDLPDFLSQIIDDSGSPFIYEKVGSRYAHFLIDEFQDTSALQWNNFKPLLEESLASGNENIIVGDAKQSIYGWRGGDASLLLSGVKRDLPIARIDPSKNTNWRSAKSIINFNNHLFSNLPHLLISELGGKVGDSEINILRETYLDTEQAVAPKNKNIEGYIEVAFVEADRFAWKAAAMQRMVLQMEELLDKGHHLNDMAILVRTNREAADIVNHVLDHKNLTNSKLEVISAEGMLLKNAAVVQLLITTFQHLLSPDDASLYAQLVYRYQQDVKGSSFEHHSDFERLIDGDLPEEFVAKRDHFLHLPIMELTEVLIRVFHLNEIKTEFAYLQAFQDAVLEFSKNRRSDLRIFMDWWEEVSEKRSIQLTGALNAVEVITSHKSKGLQYPIVFIPFCNFNLNSRHHTTWYESPYESIETIPVDYKSELAETQYAANYQKDFVKWHLEHLNIMYVAFTRAEVGLFVYAQAESKSRKYDKEDQLKSSTASKLLYQYFLEHNPSGWNEQKSVFQTGQLVPKQKEEVKGLLRLSSYPSTDWSKKLKLKKAGKKYFQQESEDQRSEGVLLHEILSEIIHWEDTDRILRKYKFALQITEEDELRYQRLINRLWENDQIKDWFNGKGVVKTEVVVLPKDGESKRLDRVVLQGNNATIIDFKSGEESNRDKRQVKEYIKLMKEMGYVAAGYLLYLHQQKVVEV